MTLQSEKDQTNYSYNKDKNSEGLIAPKDQMDDKQLDVNENGRFGATQSNGNQLNGESLPSFILYDAINEISGNSKKIDTLSNSYVPLFSSQSYSSKSDYSNIYFKQTLYYEVNNNKQCLQIQKHQYLTMKFDFLFYKSTKGLTLFVLLDEKSSNKKNTIEELLWIGEMIPYYKNTEKNDIDKVQRYPVAIKNLKGSQQFEIALPFIKDIELIFNLKESIPFKHVALQSNNPFNQTKEYITIEGYGVEPYKPNAYINYFSVKAFFNALGLNIKAHIKKQNDHKILQIPSRINPVTIQILVQLYETNDLGRALLSMHGLDHENYLDLILFSRWVLRLKQNSKSTTYSLDPNYGFYRLINWMKGLEIPRGFALELIKRATQHEELKSDIKKCDEILSQIVKGLL